MAICWQVKTVSCTDQIMAVSLRAICGVFLKPNSKLFKYLQPPVKPPSSVKKVFGRNILYQVRLTRERKKLGNTSVSNQAWLHVWAQYMFGPLLPIVEPKVFDCGT